MNRAREILSASAEATAALGERLAWQLRPGMVVALYGDLGAGKTVLSRGLARGLGIHEPVTSPTFTVVQEYPRPDGTFLFHLDLYRIADAGAALAFGIEEYLFATDGITVIEWPERIAELLAGADERHLWSVFLRHASGGRRGVTLPPAALAGLGAVTDIPELGEGADPGGGR